MVESSASEDTPIDPTDDCCWCGCSSWCFLFLLFSFTPFLYLSSLIFVTQYVKAAWFVRKIQWHSIPGTKFIQSTIYVYHRRDNTTDNEYIQGAWERGWNRLYISDIIQYFGQYWRFVPWAHSIQYTPMHHRENLLLEDESDSSGSLEVELDPLLTVWFWNKRDSSVL